MMRVSRAGTLICGLLMLALPPAVRAQQLLLHFPLDGTPAVTGSAATDSRLYLFDGGPAPTTVPGKVGSALHFSGKAAIAMPFKLDAATYPQVTITAWVRLDPDSSGDKTIFSAGNGNVPKLAVNVDRTNITAARGSLIAGSRMPRDEWTFVAGVVDVGAARLDNIQGEAALTREGINVGNLYPPSSYRNPDDPSLPAMPYVFVGSHGFNQWRASGMAIDDVRVYASALTPEQIAAIRDAGTATVAVADQTSAGTCGSGAACAARTYCAVDGSCYPNSQLPVGYSPSADGSGQTGGPAFYQAPLTEESLAHVQGIRDENAAPEITYASEQEALAAQERREREAAEAEFARQQNAVEAEQRAAASGVTDSGEPRGNSRKIIGWRLSPTDIQQTPTSGATGDIVRVLDLGDEPLTGMRIFEPNNVPCMIDIYGTQSGDRFYECTPTVIAVPDLSIFNEATIAPAAIESLQVCSTIMLNDRVKGIKISGHIIEADGSPGFYQQAKGDGPNCARWEGIVACQAGYVATGAVAHFKDRDLSESLVGMGLVCRKIEKIYE